MEINIERSPQRCPSEGSSSKLFAHENDTLTARPQLQLKTSWLTLRVPNNRGRIPTEFLKKIP